MGRIDRQYDIWSKVYDRVFTRMLQPRLERAVTEMNLKKGDKVLDVGVGTGLSLPCFPPCVSVVGLDISYGMLQRAKSKINHTNLNNVSLVQGDAMNLPFAAHTFDHVFISHMISVVPNPTATLEWAARVVKPQGKIVIVNHFRSEKPVAAAFAKLINPLCKRLGWNSNLALQPLLNNSSLKLEYRYKLRKRDLWQIVVMTRHHDSRFKTHELPLPQVDTILAHTLQTG